MQAQQYLYNYYQPHTCTHKNSPGVYFSSRSSYVNTNSNIVFTDIGEGDCRALLCFTDLIECCRDNDTPAGEGTLGQWLYPNGSVVGNKSDKQDFYIDRGPSFVRLNRRSNTMSTTGLFCCEIPDATSVNRKICMNIVGERCCSVYTTNKHGIFACWLIC